MVYIAVASVALLCLARVPAVLGHARVNSPPIRSPGNAFLQTCGKPSFNSVQNDPTGHIEEQEPVNAGCDLTLCRGMLLKDQPSSNILKVQPLQKMSMSIDCTVPHGGPANVSLVDTTTGGSGSIIGGFLKTFDNFCPTDGPAPADQTNLQYALPDAKTIGNKCQNPGDCVVQLFWATPDFSQNYYYCHDIVMPAPVVAAPTTTSVQVVAPPPTTSVQVAPPPPATRSVQVIAPPVTVAAPVTTRPAAPPASPVNGNAVQSVVPSKMLTSVASAATGLAAAVNGNGTSAFDKTNANSGRKTFAPEHAVFAIALIAGAAMF
ncbi:chitin binding protein [Favolaschia claudopus]|uniref:Chitin binding protein n=1 Tax=Favolaschia claudopus TaxID=2862362 RepID=A0AAW0EIP4_9AGAR